MKVLGIDVCTGFCSVVVVDGDIVLAQKHEPMMRGHAERLAPMVSEVLDDTGLAASDLDSIAVTTGPGSFTGARLGVSFARGLALATSIPAVGVTVFEAMMSGIDAETIAALPGKNGSVLLQRFGPGGISVAEPAEFHVETVAQVLPDTGTISVIGTATEALMAMLPEDAKDRVLPGVHADVTAEVVARLGAAKLVHSPPIPAPLYIRPADAKPQATVSLN